MWNRGGLGSQSMPEIPRFDPEMLATMEGEDGDEGALSSSSSGNSPAQDLSAYATSATTSQDYGSHEYWPATDEGYGGEYVGEEEEEADLSGYARNSTDDLSSGYPAGYATQSSDARSFMATSAPAISPSEWGGYHDGGYVEEEVDVGPIGWDHPFFAQEDAAVGGQAGYEEPPLVTECVDWLMRKGLKEKGLFRIPASLNAVKELHAAYSRGESGLVESVLDEHLVAGLLKYYFRNLAFNMFPKSLLGRMVEALSIEHVETAVAAHRSLLACIPSAQFATLGNLVRLFTNVVANRKHNKMKASNMALVFAPTLFRSLPHATATKILTFWIVNFDQVFEAEDYPAFA